MLGKKYKSYDWGIIFDSQIGSYKLIFKQDSELCRPLSERSWSKLLIGQAMGQACD